MIHICGGYPGLPPLEEHIHVGITTSVQSQKCSLYIDEQQAESAKRNKKSISYRFDELKYYIYAITINDDYKPIIELLENNCQECGICIINGFFENSTMISRIPIFIKHIYPCLLRLMGIREFTEKFIMAIKYSNTMPYMKDILRIMMDYIDIEYIFIEFYTNRIIFAGKNYINKKGLPYSHHYIYTKRILKILLSAEFVNILANRVTDIEYFIKKFYYIGYNKLVLRFLFNVIDDNFNYNKFITITLCNVIVWRWDIDMIIFLIGKYPALYIKFSDRILNDPECLPWGDYKHNRRTSGQYEKMIKLFPKYKDIVDEKIMTNYVVIDKICRFLRHNDDKDKRKNRMYEYLLAEYPELYHDIYSFIVTWDGIGTTLYNRLLPMIERGNRICKSRKDPNITGDLMERIQWIAENYRITAGIWRHL